jgi:hypothetical protein
VLIEVENDEYVIMKDMKLAEKSINEEREWHKI